jgi:8-oxo-dGTP pyrophosphatase MutT (NUDIX family)
MLFEKQPHDFNPSFEFVSCFLEHKSEILLLHRHHHKSQGGKWGLPGGKVEEGEELTQALVREIMEETGHKLAPSEAEYFKSFTVRHPEHDVIWHAFSLKLDKKPAVIIDDYEHRDFIWKHPKECHTMPLVDDLSEGIKIWHSVNGIKD